MIKSTIPMSLISLPDGGIHLTMEILVFGEKNSVIIDTGASRSIFDWKFIANRNLKTNMVNGNNAITLFGTSTPVRTIIPKIKIGNVNIKEYNSLVMDLQTVNDMYKMNGQPSIIGIIGSDILYWYNAKINISKLRISLYS